jgi:hypothetical protein
MSAFHPKQTLERCYIVSPRYLGRRFLSALAIGTSVQLCEGLASIYTEDRKVCDLPLIYLTEPPRADCNEQKQQQRDYGAENAATAAARCSEGLSGHCHTTFGAKMSAMTVKKWRTTPAAYATSRAAGQR